MANCKLSSEEHEKMITDFWNSAEPVDDEMISGLTIICSDEEYVKLLEP